MTEPRSDAGGLLSHRPGGSPHDRPVESDTAWTDFRLGVDVARQLRFAVPHGWEVSTDCLWSPAPGHPVLLQPSVVVHRPLTRDGGLLAPPVLCVGIDAGRLDLRSARIYARVGVDHYWHLDSRTGVLEVLVRVDDDYRHAETLSVDSADPNADRGAGAAQWLDFGIAVVYLSVDVGSARRDFLLEG